MTEYAKCVICGGEIREDHDAERLEASGDLVHEECHPRETRDASQGTLGGFSS